MRPDDANNDHRIVHRATLIAARPLPGVTLRAIYAYEVLSSSEWNPLQPFAPTVFHDITPFIEAKVSALAAYEDEMRAGAASALARRAAGARDLSRRADGRGLRRRLHAGARYRSLSRLDGHVSLRRRRGSRFGASVALRGDCRRRCGARRGGAILRSCGRWDPELCRGRTNGIRYPGIPGSRATSSTCNVN